MCVTYSVVLNFLSSFNCFWHKFILIPQRCDWYCRNKGNAVCQKFVLTLNCLLVSCFLFSVIYILFLFRMFDVVVVVVLFLQRPN